MPRGYDSPSLTAHLNRELLGHAPSRPHPRRPRTPSGPSSAAAPGPGWSPSSSARSWPGGGGPSPRPCGRWASTTTPTSAAITRSSTGPPGRPARLARRLLSAAIAAFVPEGVGLTFAIDETLERRWGRKIRIRGHYRDPLASSKERSVSASGIRWIVLALVVTVPWASRPWALPILSLPAPTPKVSLKLGRRHKTIAERARQMIACLRRWLPGVDLTVVGDSAYSVIELGLACRRRDVRLIAPLRLDARLFTPAPRAGARHGRPAPRRRRPPAQPRRRPGRPEDRVVPGRGAVVRRGRSRPGDRQRDGGLVPQRVRAAADPLGAGCATRPGGWSRGPTSRRGPRTSRRRSRPRFVKRWPIEVTFEETRAHLGVETQRQWSDLAIERETPCLLGLYSVVALLGEALHRASPIAIRAAAWYPKAEATFSDVLAAVRRECWGFLDIRTSQGDPSYAEIPEAAARSPAQRGLLRPLTRTKSS